MGRALTTIMAMLLTTLTSSMQLRAQDKIAIGDYNGDAVSDTAKVNGGNVEITSLPTQSALKQGGLVFTLPGNPIDTLVFLYIHDSEHPENNVGFKFFCKQGEYAWQPRDVYRGENYLKKED